MSRLLPCHGEFHVPDGYLEEQRRLVDENLRVFIVDEIMKRSQLFGREITREEADEQFDRHFLESGMEHVEADQVLQVMRKQNAALGKRRGNQT